MARGCFPVSQKGKHCFQCQFLFSRCKLWLRYTAGNFNENPGMLALAKFLRARASERSSNFFEQFEQRPNFANTFKLDGTVRYPYIMWLGILGVKRICAIALLCAVLICSVARAWSFSSRRDIDS